MATTVNYAHPYIGIQIYDNTEYTENEVVEERKDFNGMQIGFFTGGRDNQLLYMESRDAYLKEFGNPNFRKYGQAAYNVDNALASDTCGMYVMNLRPENATHANIVVMVRFKIETTKVENPVETADTQPSETEIGQQETVAAGDTEIKKLVYSFYAKTVENAKNTTELATASAALISTTPDEKGYYNMPLATFYALGRGEYGNGLHLVFSNATEYMDDDAFYDIDQPKYHTYSLTVAEATMNGLVNREVLYGNFDDEGFDASFQYGPATFFGDTINDVQEGSQKINAEIYSTTLEAICKLYNDTFDPVEKKTPANLDILTGLTLEGKLDENLKLDDKAEDYLNLFSLDGFTMKSGDDGWGDADASTIESTKEELLIKAFSGDIDPVVLSRFSSPCDFMLDANYSIPVKRQMAALANRRMYDCMTYLDLGLANTTSGMINVLTGLKNVYGFNIIKEGHTYKWRDKEYTGKVCNMTITHWLAGALAAHMANTERGLHAPMARDTAILHSITDYIPGSFKPVIDPDSNDVKNTIYRLRGNCYETLTFNSVQRSTAITSCQTNSDRLLEMNEYILQRAVKDTYDCLASRIYKLGESSDRSQFETDAKDIITADIGDYVRTVSVSLEMTAADERKSLLRIRLRLTFKTVIQNGAIEIYLDPRVTDEVVDTTTTVTIDTAEQ